MGPFESSEPGRPLLSSTFIPNLTDKIVLPDNQYCAAGGFGDVFRCQFVGDETDIKEVAVKAFRFSFSVDEDDEGGGKAARMIRRELGIWRRLDHPNIVPFLGITYGFGRQGSVSLVSTWMPYGTLHAFMKKHGDQLVAAHRLQLLLDIANGLHYCGFGSQHYACVTHPWRTVHSFPVVHGDLTSNNVLLDHDCNARLADFGCASLVGEIPEGFTELMMSTTRMGTLRWTAPEHISLDEEEAKHTTKSDIYSFGHVALFIMSGKYPWSEVRNDAAVVLMLSRGLKPGRPSAPPIDDLHWALIERCWSSVQERPLAKDLISSLRELGVASMPDTIGLAESLMTGQLPQSHPPDARGDTADGPQEYIVLESAAGTKVRLQRRGRGTSPWGPTQMTPPRAESHVGWVNTTSWFGTFSGIVPGFSGQESTELQINVAGFFTVVMLTHPRPVIYTDPWPKNLTLKFCNEPVKSNTELLFWLNRHHPWMRVMRFKPRLHAYAKVTNGQRFQALHKFMTEHRIFAYAGWQLPTGEFSYNIFIFPMGSGLVGAVFPDGLPDLPGSGNVLDIQPPREATKYQQPLDEIALPPEFIARLRQENQQPPVASSSASNTDTPESV